MDQKLIRQCLLHPPPLVWIQPESSLTDSGFFLPDSIFLSLALTQLIALAYNRRLSAVWRKQKAIRLSLVGVGRN